MERPTNSRRSLAYFAYGSNMSLRRLRSRIPVEGVLGRATLPAHDLRFHKVGRDGSAKCDAFYTGRASDNLFGVLFRIDAGGKRTLDRIEGAGAGYEARRVVVSSHQWGEIEALTYIATHLDPRLLPFSWYTAHVLAGAREAALPATWLRRLQAVVDRRDPNRRRHAREMAVHRRRFW